MSDSTIKRLALYASAGVFMFFFVIIMWDVGRKVNYSLAYEQMVQQTICDSVKREYLKIRCD